MALDMACFSRGRKEEDHAMSPGLTLSPAQRGLVEKARAVQRAKLEKEAIKQAIDGASQRHVEYAKERCKAQQQDRDARARDRKLIIRHVGEELARMAQRSPPPAYVKKQPGGRLVANAAALRQPSRSESVGREEEEDDYDEERYGPVRRPPRPRKPNLWLQVFEKEQEEVKQEREEEKRRRLAAAAEFRQQLAQQEAYKAAQRKTQQQREEEYAKMQAKQVADWKEHEKEKQRKRLEAAEEEVRRCKEDAQAMLDRQAAAQKKREQQELKTIARYKALMEKEKNQKELKKQREKEEVARVAQANAMQLALKQQERLREQGEEVRLQREYERKLQLQEEARERELQEVLAKQSQKVKLALLNVKSAEEKAREDEERAAIVQAQVRQGEEQERVKREQRRREIIQAQTRALREQKEEKKQRFVQDAKEEHASATQFRQDYLEWVEKEKAKREQVKQRNLAHNALVVRQMRDDAVRHASEDKYGMSRREMALNAELLRTIGVTRPPPDAPSR